MTGPVMYLDLDEALAYLAVVLTVRKKTSGLGHVVRWDSRLTMKALEMAWSPGGDRQPE